MAVANPERKLRIRRAAPCDAERMAVLMREVRDGLGNPEFYVISDAEDIRRKLETDSFACVVEDAEDGGDAEDAGTLAALFIFQIPGASNREDNLGYELGFNAGRLNRVLVADSVAVLPAYRGRGLQGKLLALGEHEGRRRGCDVVLATVDPRNAPSLGNFLKAGYKVVWTGAMYGGLSRHIVMKAADGRN